MGYSRAGQVILAITPKITSSFSIIGSAWIVIEVITQRSKRQNVYNRLLFAMSLFDMLISIFMFMSTWPIPADTEDVAFASGNQHTCTVQGFILQFGIIVPIYNCCLAVYYLLVVKYGVSEEKLRCYAEPLMHLLAMAFGLGTATTGLGLDLYNNANVWCWISAYPLDCEDTRTYGETNCIRGDNAWIYRYAFYYGPLWGIIGLVSWIMFSVYQAVRTRERDETGDSETKQDKAKRVSVTDISKDNKRRSSMITNKRSSSMINVNRTSSVKQTMRSSLASVQEVPERGSECDDERDEKSNIKGSKHAKTDPSSSPPQDVDAVRKTLVMPKCMADSYRNMSRRLLREQSSTSAQEATLVMETIETFASAKHQSVEANSVGSRAVFQQSLYYTLAFYVTYTFPTANRIIQHSSGKTIYVILFLHSFFIPLQGLFNVLIYRYMYFFRLKQRNPHMSGWELFEYTWRWSFMGPPRQRGDADSTRRDGSRRGSTLQSSGKRPEINQQESTMKQLPTRIDSIREEKEEQEMDATNKLDDGLDPMGDDNFAYNMVSDVLVSYAEYPNMLSEDAVMIATDFPIIVDEEFSGLDDMPLDYPPTPIDNITPQQYPLVTDHTSIRDDTS